MNQSSAWKWILGIIIIILVIWGLTSLRETNNPVDMAVDLDETTEIIVTEPLADDAVESPLTVRGEAVGSWFFEANFPVKLVDDEGNLLADTFASTDEEWMTEEMVSFESVLEFDSTGVETGFILLGRDNPSGLPENEEWVKLPVRFAATEPIDDLPVDTSDDNGSSTDSGSTPLPTGNSGSNGPVVTGSTMMTVGVFFTKAGDVDPASDQCTQVSSATRQVTKTVRVATAALTELLKGPNSAEITQGFLTSLPPDVRLLSLVIDNGIAQADFSEELNNVAGACRVSSIRTQITETLKQFPTVQSVVISVAGNSQEVLQP